MAERCATKAARVEAVVSQHDCEVGVDVALRRGSGSIRGPPLTEDDGEGGWVNAGT